MSALDGRIVAAYRTGPAGDTLLVMGGNVFTKIMVLVSVAYGITLAILGYLGSSALSLTAMIGAMVIALGWTAAGMFGRKPQIKESERTPTN